MEWDCSKYFYYWYHWDRLWIPFDSFPSTEFFENNISAIENSEFFSDTIDCLFTSERIVETHAPPDYVVDPFSVSRNSNDRPRFDLKLGSVNKHINKDRIRFDDWKVYKLESFKNNKNSKNIRRIQTDQKRNVRG